MTHATNTRTAIASNAEAAAGLASLIATGLDMHFKGQLDAAAHCYEQVLAQQPDHFEAQQLLGAVAMVKGQYQRAADLIGASLKLNPAQASAHTNLGAALMELGRLEEALACHDQSLLLNPESPQAHFNRGMTLVALQRPDDALGSIQAALKLKPDFILAQYQLGCVMRGLGHLDEAMQAFEQTLKLDPQYLLALAQKTVMLREQGRLSEALTISEEVLKLKPDYAEMYFHQGYVYADMRQLHKALDCYDKAISLKPGDVDAHCNKAHALLMLGDYANGWPLYEWRWKQAVTAVDQPHLSSSLWHGLEPLKGKIIILHGEQGLGDMIQFARYVPLVASQGAIVVLAVNKALSPILGRLPGVAKTLHKGDPIPVHDFHCPLMSLPLAFKTTLDNMPPSTAYLSVTPAKREQWSQWLGPRKGLRVGLVWSGNPNHANDRKRSIALHELLPHLPLGIDYLCLQKELRSEDAAQIKTRTDIRFAGDVIEDFDDTAALCDQMDVVLSVDTSVAHLAGALGVPVWLLLPHVPDWRWMLERTDSPWYASMKLYRQSERCDWSGVLARVQADLTGLTPGGAAGKRLQSFDECALHAVQLLMAERYSQAIDVFDLVLKIKPDAATCSNRGVALQKSGRLQEAIDSYARAIELDPAHAEAYVNLGLALKQANRTEDAVECYARLLELRPQHEQACMNQSTWLQELKRFEEALVCCDKLISIKPEDARAHFNRGGVLLALTRYEQALESFEQAIRLKPDFSDALYNCGNAMLELGRLQEAVDCFKRALLIQPASAEVSCNLGNALFQLGRVDEAIASFNKAIADKPNYPEAHSNLSLALLLKGQFRQGWEMHEWRWKKGSFTSPRRNFAQDLWLGDADLKGKTILLHAEQGLGDTIQFCRYAKRVKALGARVLLEVPKQLVTVLQGLEGVDVLLAKGEPLPAFDLQAPLMSLPLAFKTEINTIPGEQAYLSVPPHKRSQWTQCLGAKSRPRVGLVWRGSRDHKNDRNRSLQLSELLAHLPKDCEYVSLQKELRSDDAAVLAGSTVRHMGDQLEDFSDTAALCEQMDVIVSVDTSVAHLAGALGKPVWLLLPHVPDWRWLLERSDSPWYASMKLYRQTSRGDWAEVLARVGKDLALWAAKQVAAAPKTESVQDKLASPTTLKIQPQISINSARRVQTPTMTLLFEQGMALHKQGDTAKAAQIYEKVLDTQPDHFDARHLLGVTALQAGQHERAAALIGRALEIKPNSVSALVNLGVTLKELKRFDEALAIYDKALAIEPARADAWVNRGVALKELGRNDDAIAAYEKAIALEPSHEGALYNLANALSASKRHEQALASYDKVLAINPANAMAHCFRGMVLKDMKRYPEAGASADAALQLMPRLAMAHNLRGMALDGLNRKQEAIASYEIAVQLDPMQANAHYNMGIVWAKCNEPAKALTCYNRAIDVQPGFADAHVNRGIVLNELQRFDEAVQSYHQALALNPKHVQAHSNLGNVLRELGDDEASIRCYDKAIALDPAYAEAYWNKALALLLRGDLAAGLPLYEWRKEVELYKHKQRHFAQPAWTGVQDLNGQTVLLYAEQGFGDTIQFCRYASMVAASGANVVLEVQRPLVDLLAKLKGVSQVVAAGESLPAFDMQCSLMSLPLAFGTTVPSIPVSRKYLVASADKKRAWTKRLGRAKRLRIGLAWSGNPHHKNDHNRSLSLEELLSGLPEGPQYVCIQKELRESDKAVLASNPQIEFYGEELNDFSDTAALCAKLDVIVSVDTSVAHLAGALGVPVWLLLPHVPDWRWLLERTDSPWYAGMKLYRQASKGDWPGLLARLREDLQAQMATD